MAYHIEIILAADDLSAINLGHKNHFVLKVWPGEKIPKRINDIAATTRNHRFGIGAIN